MNFLKISLVLSFAALFSACGGGTTYTANATASITSNATPNAAAATNIDVSAPQQSAKPDELAEARGLYETNCAQCHKNDGTGGKVDIEGTIIKADNLTTDKMKKMSDAKYIDYIVNGVPDEGMPAFKDRLNAQQTKDIVKFIRTEIQKQ